MLLFWLNNFSCNWLYNDCLSLCDNILWKTQCWKHLRDLIFKGKLCTSFCLSFQATYKNWKLIYSLLEKVKLPESKGVYLYKFILKHYILCRTLIIFMINLFHICIILNYIYTRCHNKIYIFRAVLSSKQNLVKTDFSM